jgi:hypothetical protein
MVLSQEKLKGGLLPLPADPRDFQLGWVVKLPALEELPAEFVLEGYDIKNQGATDFCAAFAAVGVSELQENVKLSPEWQFAKAKQLVGSLEGWGLTLREVVKSLVRFGSIEKAHAPYEVGEKERDFLADWQNWPAELDTKATAHKKQSYFAVTGPYDAFDNIRASIYHYREKKRAVLLGLMWGYDLQTNHLNWITEFGFGHALYAVGWKVIEREPAIVLVNSYGREVGDNGVHYISRRVMNRWAKEFGIYMFIDEKPEKAKKNWGIRANLYNLWMKVQGFFTL